MDRYSSAQAAVVDRDNRNMAAAGYPMSQEIDDLWSSIDAGEIGITSVAPDVDSMCKGGGEFTIDTDTSPAGGYLNFSWLASRFHNGKSLVVVAAGTIVLAASQTNYVEVSRAGTVSSNTSGFTAGRLPLWAIITGSSSWQLANVTSQKPHLTLIGTAGVTGDMLSTAGSTKRLTKGMDPDGVTTTQSCYLIAPNVASILTGALIMSVTGVATSDTNYWTLSITNLGQAGVGTTPMLAATAANTTKATGGSAFVAAANRALTLHGTPGTDANLNVAANDVLQVTLTITASATALTLVEFALDFQFTA